MLTHSRSLRWCSAVAWGLSPFALSCSQLLGDVDLKDMEAVRPEAPVVAPIRPDPSMNPGFGPLPSGAPAAGESSGASAVPLDAVDAPTAGAGASGTDETDAPDVLPPDCVPGARRCTVATLELCDETAAWTSLETCVSAAHCDSAFDRCQPAPCEPDLCRCNAGVVEVCSADQLGWDVLEQCASPALCESDPEGTTAVCLEPACAAGERRCTEDGTLETCRADRTGFEPSPPCGDAESCESLDAACLPSEGAVEPGSDEGADEAERGDEERGDEERGSQQNEGREPARSDDQREQDQRDDERRAQDQRDERDDEDGAERDEDRERADRDDGDRGNDDDRGGNDDDRGDNDDDRGRGDDDDPDRGNDDGRGLGNDDGRGNDGDRGGNDDGRGRGGDDARDERGR